MTDKPSLPLQRYAVTNYKIQPVEGFKDAPLGSIVVVTATQAKALEQYVERLEQKNADRDALVQQMDEKQRALERENAELREQQAFFEGLIDRTKMGREGDASLRKFIERIERENADLSAALTKANDERVRLEGEVNKYKRFCVAHNIRKNEVDEWHDILIKGVSEEEAAEAAKENR